MMSMSVTMHPIWQSGAAILAGAIVVALALQIAVQRVLPATLRQEHTVLGGAIFSVIGTTYAVLLAFMAMTAWEQYSTAQRLAEHEANLIGSVYQTSDGLPEPGRTALRNDLKAYLEQIIDVEWPAQVAGRQVSITQPLLTNLLHMTFDATSADSGLRSLLVNALNDIAADRRDRRIATHGTIPDLVWIVLLSGGALVVGFNFMLGGPTLVVHLIMTAALAGSGVLVLLLIVGLSSPFRGAVAIAPDAYTEVLAEIRAVP